MKKYTVLLLENDGEEKDKMESLLVMYGFSILSGKDGLEGLRLLYNHTPDLIIANTKLPVVDGFDILKTVKSNKRLKDVPFIFTTTVLDEQKILLSKKLGANAHIKMPSSCTLLYAIKRCLQLDMLIAS